ncbi:hypothetical protein ZWY2020_004329 [Hordeum vulgare]|nr:hypothetical protein ZWY2020_004329 [Hordeum vulgare]
MMAHAGGSSSSGGGASESNWPQSLDKPLTEELHGYGLLVPPGCRLTKPWRIYKDGYPTLDDPATSVQLRIHPGGRHNIRDRHAFWDGKSYYDVINRHRQATTAAGNGGSIQRRRRAAIPHPPSAVPAMATGSGPDGVRSAARTVRPPRGRQPRRLTGATRHHAGVSGDDGRGGEGRGRDRGGGIGGKPVTRR